MQYQTPQIIKPRSICLAITAIWLSGCNGASSTTPSTIVPTPLPNSPYIIFSTRGLNPESTATNTSFSVIATLEEIGNKSIPPQTVESLSLTLNSNTYTNESFLSFSPSSCIVSSESDSCTINVHLGTLEPGNYSLNMQNKGSVTELINNTIDFTVIPICQVGGECVMFEAQAGGYGAALGGILGARNLSSCGIYCFPKCAVRYIQGFYNTWWW